MSDAPYSLGSALNPRVFCARLGCALRSGPMADQEGPRRAEDERTAVERAETSIDDETGSLEHSACFCNGVHAVLERANGFASPLGGALGEAVGDREKSGAGVVAARHI